MDIKIITVFITCLISCPLVSQNTLDFLNKGVTKDIAKLLLVSLVQRELYIKD